jgi:hypothetical protein
VPGWGQRVPAPAMPVHEVANVGRVVAWVGMMGAQVGSTGACTCCASTWDGHHGEGSGAGGNGRCMVGVNRCYTCCTSAQSGCREVGGGGSMGGSTGVAASTCCHQQNYKILSHFQPLLATFKLY